MILERPVDAQFWAELGVELHPVCPLPDEAWLRAHTREELIGFLLDRQSVIDAMREDPLRSGWEPATWRILDALCGFPWMETDERPAYADGRTLREWSLEVRRKLLRQEPPLKVLLLNGGNRGGKSEWAASRVMRILLSREGRRAWAFHQDSAMSREYQQPLLYKYLPGELRTEKGIKRNPTYIAYKQQTGFSEDRFVLPNRGDCSFRNYEQDAKKIQGGELDVVWCDELVPATWVKELKARVATRNGWLLITFTPIEGYSATVKAFLDIAVPTVLSVAFTLPKDGQAPRPDLAMAGEDPMAWLRAETKGNAIQAGQPPVPAGREFELVKRVMCCPADRRQGVFFFHSFDNPFGNPTELYALYRNESAVGQKMRFYGEATKQTAAVLKFVPEIHIIPDDRIPKDGTNYQIVDPCSGRNWAMAWARVNRAPVGKRYFIYREWPCPGVYVPGVGDLGMWAEPGEKLDGERGPAQVPLRWGLDRYKQEIARLEGRRDWEMPVQAARELGRNDDPDLQPDREPVRRGRRKPSEGEDVYERIMDSRYGATPNQTREGTTTLLEECAEIGLDFVPASGGQSADDDTKVQWTHLINDLLSWDETKPLSSLNQPRLLVAASCKNMIFALQNWTGQDGKHGACKDFVDLVKYLVLHDCEDWSDSPAEAARRRREKQIRETEAA